MPRRLTQTKPGTHQAMKNTAYESRLVSWLMHDGWQVFLPILDHGHKTDLLISDGPNYFRIQVKTVDAGDGNPWLLNGWNGSNIDILVVFARNSNWGIIAPAFAEKRRRVSHSEHRKFAKTKNDFLREFHKFEI